MRRPALLLPGRAQRARRHAAALAVVAIAVATCQVAATGASAGPAAAAQPAPCRAVAGQPSGGSPRIMIVGDSITKGSSGDFTWQYRLYEHLRADGVRPQMVGPYSSLFNNVTNVDGDCSYADPKFERANDAKWGLTLFEEKSAIRAKVARYRPSYLLVLLGLDDLFWFGKSQSDMAANLRSFIAAARAGGPRIRIVLGLIPPDIHQQTSPAFHASIATYNHTLSSTAARLSTAASPIAVAHDGTGLHVAADLWDGTHPNANGEVKIAAGFADALASRFHLGRAYPTPFPVLPTGPLTHPQLTVTPSSTAGQAALSWTLAPGANGYYVYVRNVTKGDTTFTRLSVPLSPGQDPWTVGLLISGDSYDFKLQACKGADCGVFSNVATVTAP